MRPGPFRRPTVVAAIEFLGAASSQARFDQIIVRLGLSDEIPLASPKSVASKAALLAHAVMSRAACVIETVDGQMTLAEAIVRTAVEVSTPEYGRPEQVAFLRGLALDGFAVSWDEDSRAPSLRAALPDDVGLLAADDEVHRLLEHFDFVVSMGHLDQAIEAHTRGDWAASNSQARSFLEGLLSDIANNLDPQKASQLPSSENRRALLAELGFLSRDRNEWTTDGKNFFNGLFKMLHTEGSHPGLSDESHSTFRLHLVLVTSRALLLRLSGWNRLGT